MKFRRLLCLLMAILLVVNLGVPALAAAAGEAVSFVVEADKDSYGKGDTVKLTIRQSEDVTGLGLWDFTLYFDHEALQLNQDACENKTGRSSVTIAEKVSNAGAHQVSVMDTDISFGDGFTIPGGDVAVLTFTALKEGTTEATCLVTMSDSQFNSEFNSNTGNIQVPEKVTITVAAAVATYTVKLPTGDSFVAASSQSATVEAGKTFTFTVTAAEGYEGTPVVKVGGETLTANTDGSYTITVNADVDNITVEGFTQKQGSDDGMIPEGAPFTALTTDAGAVLKIEDKGTVDYNGFNTYAGVPYYHVTIPAGATSVFVTHPASEDPFVDGGNAYGYYAQTDAWTGGGLTYTYDGSSIQLPLSFTGTAYDESWNQVTVSGSFVADENGNVSYAVAVERQRENGTDFSPICFFTFEYGEADPEYTVSLPENPEGYTVSYTGSNTLKAGETFTFTVTANEGYEKKEHFAVTAGSNTLTANDDGSYTITVNGDVEVSVAGIEKKTYTVTLPSSIAYTAASEQSATVAHGETFTFTVTAKDGYTGTPVVKAGTETLTANEDGSYTITVTENVTVEISGIELVYEGYGIRASEDKTITASEEAEVSFVVEAKTQTEGAAAATVYNAYDLTVSYNADVVNYDSYTAAEEEELTVTADTDTGTIRIQGYGPDKAVNTAPVTLIFTGNALGEADVTVTSAKVDIGVHAIENDAPDAAILEPTTVITVTGYTVELGEGLKADSTVAENGVDYIFHPTDAANYTYVVTYTVEGQTQTYTAQANTDGSYTIPGAHITGNITLKAEMTPKRYQVDVSGDDVTGADNATYNTPYTFTVNKQSGYSYTISVLRNNETYTGYTDNGDGTYTIPGTDITADFKIVVTRSKLEDNTVSVNKPAWVTGASSATKGQSYTFTVPKEEGYTYGELKVTMGGTDITSNLTVSGNSYTIASVTGNIVITITRTSTLEVNVVPYITLNDKKVMYLVTASGSFASGYIAKYDGQSMYWSDAYEAYAWLLVSADNLQTVVADAENKVTMAQGTAAGTVVYTGDVNGTQIIDINDAQLTYDMYNAKYSGFTDVTMQKFLNADVNGDTLVDVTDARAVVAAIR